MDDSDTPETGPLSIDDYLDSKAPPEDTPDKQVEEETEVEPEVEAEAEAEAESEAEDEPEADEDGPQVLTVEEYGDVLIKVGDETTTLAELQKGTLRQSDYSRKTQDLARERKEMQAEIAAREEALEARERQLNEQFAQLDAEPDWLKLAQEDPLGYIEQKAQWEAKSAKASAAKRDLEQRQQKAVREFSRKTAEIAVSKIPEWTDAEKFDAGGEARKRVALDAGFTEAEYSQVYDFRLAVLLEKAARYDSMSADTSAKNVAAEKRIAKAPKVLKPGQSSSKADKAQAEKAAREKRLRGPVDMHTYLSAKGY